MSQRGRRWGCGILILILILLILWFLQRHCGDGGVVEEQPPAPPYASNQPPVTRNDQLNGCTVSPSEGDFSCTIDFPAGTLFNDHGNGADSDPDGDPFTASIAGMDVVGGTGDSWSPPGPSPRDCNDDFLCATDRNFVAARSSLTINPDGGFSLTYTTRVDPFGTLIAEFLYKITDTESNTSDPALVEVYIH